jgi:prepilin signal peptidase PulO-like enzyme (type II secretory pathway)
LLEVLRQHRLNIEWKPLPLMRSSLELVRGTELQLIRTEDLQADLKLLFSAEFLLLLQANGLHIVRSSGLQLLRGDILKVVEMAAENDFWTLEPLPRARQREEVALA